MTQPEEAARLIANPSTILTAERRRWTGLIDVIKFGKARMILGGTTTTQGAGSHAGVRFAARAERRERELRPSEDLQPRRRDRIAQPGATRRY